MKPESTRRPAASRLARPRHVAPALIRTATTSWQALVRAGKWCASAWSEREKDGRVRYAVAGLGLGLLVGSIAAVFLDRHLPPIPYTDFGPTPASSLVFLAAVLLVGHAIFWGDGDGKDPRTIYESAIAKAAEDPEFREELKADPRRTIERETPGWTPPADLEITVVEDLSGGEVQRIRLVTQIGSSLVGVTTPEHIYLVLPAASPDRSGKQQDAVSADETESNPSVGDGTER